MIELQNGNGGVVKFSPAMADRMWFDNYENGALVGSMAIIESAADDVVMEFMLDGYFMT